MAHYLLIARFTMDDIPLALLKDKSWAEKRAKDLQADPSLLSTKWKDAIKIWPQPPGGFVGAMVLHIDVMGDPVGVTFDSTEYVDDEDTQPPEPQPIQSTIPVPDGYVEITDPNHKLRPHVDFYLSRNWYPGECLPITETDAVLVSDWGQPGYRFCCPATQHPDLQGTSPPAETDELTILREANEILVKKQVELVNDIEILCKANAGLLAENNTLIDTRTQLHKTVSELLEERSRLTETHVPELQAVNAILKKDNDHLRSSNSAFGERNAASQAEIRDLHAKVAHLQAEYNRVADQMANDGRAYGLLSTQNADLRRLNEDLNQRLNATLARASHATDLESRIRGMAVRLLRFAEEIGNRAKWSKVFGNEGLMPPAYHKAMAYCWTDFTFQLEEFVRAFPHVSPDMPDHLKIDAIDPGDEADDDDGTTD